MLGHRHKVVTSVVAGLGSVVVLSLLLGCAQLDDRVPHLVGLKLSAAEAELKADHLAYKVTYVIHSSPKTGHVARNQVVAQDPKAGSPARSQTIDVYVAA